MALTTFRTEGHRRAVGSALCLLAVLNALCGHKLARVAGLEQLASRAMGCLGGSWRLGGVGSGGIRVNVPLWFFGTRLLGG